MKDLSAGALVLVLNFFSMIVAAILGAILGGDNHPVCGALVGGLTGYAAPCILAHLIQRRLRSSGHQMSAHRSFRSTARLLLAAVATNEWVTPDNEELVQALRGITVAGLFGLMCGSLTAGWFAGAALLPVIAGSAGGAVAFVLLAVCAEVWL